jgi:hypothetical protein
MQNITSIEDCDAVRGTAGAIGDAGPASRGCDLRAVVAFGGVASLVVAVIGAAVLIKPPPASAVPSFARQTGQPCAASHTAFPELTPFGRRFKLGGYTTGGGLTFEQAPPVAGMMIPTFTHTARNQDAPPVPVSSAITTRSCSRQASSTAAKFTRTLARSSRAPTTGPRNTCFDNTDVHYADTTKVLGVDVLYGVSVNNNPTVQDVWNTTPAWGFPYIASTLAPQFAPPGTMIEGRLAGKVVGTGVYTFWNDMLYLEVSAYQNLSKQTLEVLGEPNISGSTSIGRAAPYLHAGFEFPAIQLGRPRPIGGLLLNTTSATRVLTERYPDVSDESYTRVMKHKDNAANSTLNTAVKVDENRLMSERSPDAPRARDR